MAVYKERGEIPSAEQVNELERKLYEGVKEGRYEKSPITEKPKEAMDTLEYLETILDDYYTNPEKYQDLKTYLSSKGRQLKDPKILGIYDDKDYAEAVARTNTEDSLEVNYHFKDLVTWMAEEHGLSEEEVEELVLTHELVHLAQPGHIKKGMPMPYVAEIDAELVLTQYFADKAMNASNQMKDKYERMAQATYERAIMMYTAMDQEMNKDQNISRPALDKDLERRMYETLEFSRYDRKAA
jgi:hypothetical protein